MPHPSPQPYAPAVLRLGPPHDVHPAEALPRLAGRRLPALLDSSGGAPRRFSLLAFDPVAVATPESLGSLGDLPAFVAGLRRAGGDPIPGPFQGGFVGALAYDLGVAGEDLDLPAEPWGFPPVVGGLYTDFLVRDEESGETWLVVGDAARREGILAELERPADLAAPRGTGDLVRCVASAEHRARIERARAWIAAGEMYQANVAHRFTRPMEGDPRALYGRLRAENPAPYAGYLGWGEGALLSSSPELLLEFDPGIDGPPSARTRPIKGTIPRGATAEEDAANVRTLLASAKDRAELAMIVDLERNDLGRIAETGSVRVEDFPRLESYASVHHLVADVVCTPRAGVGAVDALAALFPGGSITGAPKLRSMELIAELEGEGRGFFTGSLGFLGLDGRAVFNILIRSLLWRPGEVSFRVGGGITWASDPAAEDEETLAKGAALARALSAPGADA